MKKFMLSLVFGVIVLLHQASADFTYTQLEDLINGSHVRSIDELLPLLPVEFRQSYTLVYESRSLQKHDVYPEFPRVILRSADARLLVAFTKGPKQGPAQIGPDNLETIEYNDQSKGFVFRQFEFGQNGGSLRSSPEKNPQACLKCHGDSPRPNWQAYNMWPGVFGSMSRLGCDTMKADSKESKYYQNYLSTTSHEGRYAFLPEAVGPGKCSEGRSDEVTFTNGIGTEPNSSMNDAINILNFDRIANIVKQSALYPRFKYLIKGTSKPECSGTPFDFYFPDGYIDGKSFLKYGQWWEKVIARQRTVFSDALQRFNLYNAAADVLTHRPVNFLDPADDDGYSDWTLILPAAVKIKVLADRMNLDMRYWSTNFSDIETYNFEGPTTGPDLFFSSFGEDSELDSLDCLQLLCKSRQALGGDAPQFCKN